MYVIVAILLIAADILNHIIISSFSLSLSLLLVVSLSSRESFHKQPQEQGYHVCHV